MAFSEAARRQTTRKAFGFRIALAAQGSYPAFTVCVATQDVTSDDSGDVFYGLVAAHSDIRYSIEFGQPIVKAAKVKIDIFNRALQGMPYIYDEPKISELLQVYDWAGAPFEVVLLCEEVNGTVYERCIYEGHIYAEPELDATAGVLPVEAWNLQPLQTNIGTTVKLADHANAPQQHVGYMKPIVYGDCYVDDDAGFSDADQLALEKMGLIDLGRLVPTVCIDKNGESDTDDVVFQIADHEAKTLGDDNAYLSGLYFLSDEAERPCPFDSPTYDNDSTDGARGKLTTFHAFYLALAPQSIHALNTATNPMYATDGDMETYADITGYVNTVWRMQLSRPPDVGYIGTVTVYALIDYDLTYTPATIRIRLVDASSGSAIGATTTITGGTGSYEIQTAVAYTDAQSAAEIVSDPAIDISFTSGSSSDWMKIREVRLVCQVYPRALPPKLTSKTPRRKSLWQPRAAGPGRTVYIPKFEEYLDLDDATVKIYAAAEGRMDSDAIWTGTSTSLLDLPAHIVGDLMEHFGGIGSSNFVNGVAQHGDFDDTGDDQDGAYFQMAFALTQPAKLQEIIERINEQSCQTLIQVHADYAALGTPKWGMVWWGSGYSTNYYGRPLHADFVKTCKIGRTDARAVKNEIKCPYEYCHHEGACRREAYVDKDGSDDGYGGTLNQPADFTDYEDSYARFNTLTRSLKLDLIKHRPSACKTRNLIGAFHVLPRVRLEIEFAGWEYIDLQVGMTVDIDNDSFFDKGWRYPGLTGTEITGGLGKWENTFTTDKRYFWVEDVVIGLNYMKVILVEGNWVWT